MQYNHLMWLHIILTTHNPKYHTPFMMWLDSMYRCWSHKSHKRPNMEHKQYFGSNTVHNNLYCINNGTYELVSLGTNYHTNFEMWLHVGTNSALYRLYCIRQNGLNSYCPNCHTLFGLNLMWTTFTNMPQTSISTQIYVKRPTLQP